MNKSIRTLLAGAIVLLAFQTVQLTLAAALPVYVFSSFTGDTANDMKLRIYASADATNFTLYRITLHDSPKFHVKLGADGFVVWGVTIKAPSKASNGAGTA